MISKASTKEDGILYEYDTYELLIAGLKAEAVNYRTLLKSHKKETVKRSHSPLFLPVNISDAPRSEDSVIGGVTMAVYDVDNETTDKLDIKTALRKLDYRATIVTSMSHDIDGAHDKYRILIPFTGQSITRHQIKGGFLYEILMHCGIPLRYFPNFDKKCITDFIRGYYVPGVNAKWHEVEGDILDIQDVEEREELTPAAEKPKRRGRQTSIFKACEAYGIKDYSNLDIVKLFKDKKLQPSPKPSKDGFYGCLCPFSAAHTDDTLKTGAFFRADEGQIPFFKCHHNSCEGKNIADVINLYNGATKYVVSQFDIEADPNTDETIIAYLNSISHSSVLPRTQDQALVRYRIVNNMRGSIYDIAVDEFIDKATTCQSVGSRILVPHDKGLKPWRMLDDSRTQLISSKGIKFDVTEKTKAPEINIFKGLAIKSVAKTDTKIKDRLKGLMSDMACVVCGGFVDQGEWLLDWIAHPLRNTHCKMNSAVILRSSVTGIGKSLLLNHMPSVVYGQYFKKLENKDLDTGFNEWIKTALFACADDIVTTRDEAYKISGPLRSLITEKTVRWEKKYQNSETVRNNCNFCFTSNGLMPIVLLEHSRRFFVGGTDDKEMRLRNEEYQFFAVKGLEENKRLIYDLLIERKTQKGMETQDAIETPMLAVVREQSSSSSQVFLSEFVNTETGIDPMAPITLTGLYNVYGAWCRSHGQGRVNLTRFKTEMTNKGFEKKHTMTFSGYLHRDSNTVFTTTLTFKTQAREFIENCSDENMDDIATNDNYMTTI